MKKKMNDKKKSKTELLRLIDTVGDDLLLNADGAETYLKDSGYDIEDLQREGINFINTLKGKSRLELAKKKRSELVEKIKKYWNKIEPEFLNKTREDLIKILISSKGEQLRFQFRNLEKLSDDDLLEMSKEEQLLEYIEKIQNE